MLFYGAAWIAAGSTLAASAQLAAPAWVRARAIAIYQLSFFGVMALGSALAGWVGARFGVRPALGAASVGGVVGPRGPPLAARRLRRPRSRRRGTPRAPPRRRCRSRSPGGRAAAACLASVPGRVLEVVRYRIDPAERTAFLAAMQEVRRVRLRSGAVTWRLYEDVAHPERWVELWTVENWTEHLREAHALTEGDRAALARAAALHRAGRRRRPRAT